MALHKFTIRGTTYTVPNGTLVGTLALLKLPEITSSPMPNPRVLAIKFLRMLTGFGLMEAKFIVDFLAEKVELDVRGEPIFPTPPLTEVTYDGTGD